MVHTKAATDAGYFLLPSVNHVPLLLTSAQPQRRQAELTQLQGPRPPPRTPSPTPQAPGAAGQQDRQPRGCQGGGTPAGRRTLPAPSSSTSPEGEQNSALRGFHSSSLSFRIPQHSRRAKAWLPQAADTRGCSLPSLSIPGAGTARVDPSPEGQNTNTHKISFSLFLTSFCAFQRGEALCTTG